MSTRQERRRAERAAKKEEKLYKMHFEFLQPWSTFVMKTQLPPEILQKMLKITDEIVANAETAESHGKLLAGQIKHELLIDPEILEREGVMVFFMDVTRNFVIQQFCQSRPSDLKAIMAEKWYTKLLSMWIISQKDNEYNPIHIHTECQLSTVLYLKVPEFLPSTKPERDDDGNIMFIGGGGNNSRLTRNLIKWKPNVGDFFIFPAHLQHCVYPFKTEGAQERRSVSFNADFISRQQLETEGFEYVRVEDQ